jgi:hypothetical protein
MNYDGGGGSSSSSSSTPYHDVACSDNREK